MRLVGTELYRTELKARMPFRYGIATLTELPHVFIRATLVVDGRTESGVAADHLPPKWFTKDPSRDPKEEIGDMLAAIRQAQVHAREVGAGADALRVLARTVGPPGGLGRRP